MKNYYQSTKNDYISKFFGHQKLENENNEHCYSGLWYRWRRCSSDPY